MTKTMTAATLTMLFTLGACGTVEKTMEKVGMKEPAGISAVDCFSAGGTIDNSSGKSMCKGKDGTMTPVL